MSRPGRLRSAPERVRIDALTHDGRGVAHVAGRAVFIPGALAGEEASIQRVHRRRGHDEARLLEVLTPSPDRVAPRCEYFGVCGGCALQHLEQGAQLAAKQGTLLESFKRIGHVAPERVLDPLAGAAWHYRRRARLSARHVHAKSRVVVGFRERAANYVTDMRHCAVLAPPANELIGALADLLDQLDIGDRIPQIEVAVADAQTAFVLRVLTPPSPADRERLAQFAQRHGICWYLQSAGPDSVEPLTGTPPAPHYRLEHYGLDIEFAPTDFVQVNRELNPRLVAHALALLAPQSSDAVLDLYCGVGNFTLPLARLAGTVTGVEGDAVLVQRARSNAQRNALGNTTFHVADLNGDIAPWPWARARYDRVLLDPPRAGAGAALRQVAVWQPRRLVYVSCDPATLARDAGMLEREHGYRLCAAGVVDMFPHTAHIEAVASFEPAR